MPRFFTAVGLAALFALGYAQYRSFSLFDDSSSGQPTHSLASQGRSYHK